MYALQKKLQFQLSIIKLYDHLWPSTTSHYFAATTHSQRQPTITFVPTATTTHKKTPFHHCHPQPITSLKNEVFRSYFSTNLHRLVEHAFWFANQATDFFGRSQWKVPLSLSYSSSLKCQKKWVIILAKYLKANSSFLVTLWAFFL